MKGKPYFLCRVAVHPDTGFFKLYRARRGTMRVSEQLLELPDRQLSWDKIKTVALKKSSITFATSDGTVVVTVENLFIDNGDQAMAFLVTKAIETQLSNNTERMRDLSAMIRSVIRVQQFTILAMAAYVCIVPMGYMWVTNFSMNLFGIKCFIFAISMWLMAYASLFYGRRVKSRMAAASGEEALVQRTE